jgi:hypothetical protein
MAKKTFIFIIQACIFCIDNRFKDLTLRKTFENGIKCCELMCKKGNGTSNYFSGYSRNKKAELWTTTDKCEFLKVQRLNFRSTSEN